MKSFAKASQGNSIPTAQESFVSKENDEDAFSPRRANKQEPETRLGHLRKLEAMDIFVGRWKKGISAEKDPSMNTLLEEFSLFVRDYIDLLSQIPASVANPREIAATGLEQLYHEWSMLSKASEQRLQAGGSDTELEEKLRSAQDTLTAYFDCWQGVGENYLPPLKSVGGHSMVVPYFDKGYAILRSVYAPRIPVISIPLTDYGSERRWEAMAHEAAHHLYWNALDLEATDLLQEGMEDLVVGSLLHLISPSQSVVGSSMANLQQAVNRMVTWYECTEEVFADVVGTLLAGPAYVVTSQNLAAEQVGQYRDLLREDRHHPFPGLRPIIGLETLIQMVRSTESTEFADLMQGNTGIIRRLDDRWRSFCGEEAGQQVHHLSGATLEELEEDIRPIVQQLLHAPIWPDHKSLLQLIRFFCQTEMSDEQRRDLLYIQTVPPIAGGLPSSEQLPSTPATVEPVIPKRLQNLWDYLAKKAREENMGKGEETLTAWKLLITLGLSQEHGHETAHAYCTKHKGYYNKRHRHDPDSSAIILC